MSLAICWTFYALSIRFLFDDGFFQYNMFDVGIINIFGLYKQTRAIKEYNKRTLSIATSVQKKNMFQVLSRYKRVSSN